MHAHTHGDAERFFEIFLFVLVLLSTQWKLWCHLVPARVITKSRLNGLSRVPRPHSDRALNLSSGGLKASAAGSSGTDKTVSLGGYWTLHSILECGVNCKVSQLSVYSPEVRANGKQGPRRTIRDSQYIDSSESPVSCTMWTDLSPHLQRNKLLHDTLLQRDEELVRLQEENHKLRQFLNSSFVKDLEEKAKKLFFGGKRKRNWSPLSPPISKRVCRNLTAEFCSESEPSESSLDLWVLKTLGLKDKDTIDTTDTATDHNNSINNHYHSPIVDNPTGCNVYHSSPIASMHQRENQDTKESGLGNFSSDFSTSNDYNSSFAFSNGLSPNTSLTLEKEQEVSQWSSPMQTISYNPLERLHFSPVSCSTPIKSNKNGGSAVFSSDCRPDLAFSMSLSPNHSLKTHSFPHGQAFVRRDGQGRCNFTWMPRDRP